MYDRLKLCLFVSVLSIFKRLLATLASSSSSESQESEEFLDLGSVEQALDSIPTQKASYEVLDTLYTDVRNMTLNEQSEPDIRLLPVHQKTLTNRVKEHFPTQYQAVLKNKIRKLDNKTLNSLELMKVTYETIIMVIMSLRRKDPSTTNE